MTGASSPAVIVERLTVREGDALLLQDVSFTVERASIHAVVAGEEATSALLGCVAGARTPASGRVSVLGRDPRARWRLRGRRVFVPKGSGAALAAEMTRPRSPELLLLESPPDEAGQSGPAALRALASRGTAVLLGTDRARLAAAADRIGLIVRRRLIADGSPHEVAGRFRRIQYANRQTETRTRFGNELDEFHAVSVRVRGWGITAIVLDFDEAAFDRFRRLDGVEDARAEPMTLEELVAELVEARG